jgi:hypothetical protein
MTQMPGDMIGALKLVPEKEVDGMFDQLITEKALSIGGRSGAEQLFQLQGEIQAIREMKAFFKSERAR